MTTELDDRIRATVHTIAHCASNPVPWPEVSVLRNAPKPVRHRRRRRNFIAATAAAALVAAAAFGAVQLRTSATDPERPATTHAGVFNEVVDVTRAVDAPCPGDTPAEARPVQFRTETWGSDRLGRYRAQVTPATGGTHDTLIEIANGAVSHTWNRGSDPIQDFAACGTGPAPGGPSISVGSLNPLSTRSLPLGVSAAASSGPTSTTPGAPPGVSFIRVGARRDSVGRAAILWRQPDSWSKDTNGVHILGPSGTSWYLDPDTNRILELVRVNDLDGRLVTTRQVLVTYREAPLDPSTFSSKGYRPVLGWDISSPLPAAVPSPIPATVSVGATSIWPSTARDGSSSELARAFAAEVFGWTSVSVPPPGSGSSGNLTITDRAGASVALRFTSDEQGSLRIVKVGSGIGAGPGGVGLAFGEFPSATVAEISSLRDGAPISWRARAPKAGENATADVGPLGPTTLILYRDATGHVIGAAGQAFNP